MFGKRKSGAKQQANHLSLEAEPNVLTSEGDEPEAELDDEFEDFNENEESDDEESPEDETPEEARRRAAELQSELQRQAEEYGLTSVDPVTFYGPNGADVEELLESLASIDLDTAELISDAWMAAPSAERTVVRRVLQRRFQSGRLGEYAHNAENAVDEWLHTKTADDDADLRLWREVAEAARDAVDALVLDDKLDDMDFNTLYGPWSDVMNSEDGEDEGAGETEPAAKDGSAKDGSAQEVPADDSEAAEGVFGPNTQIVLAFIEKLNELTTDEITALVEAWRDLNKHDLRIAHKHLQSLADEDPRWHEQLRLAQEEVLGWMSGKTGAETRVTTALARVREPAGPVVADSIAALVVADILDPEDAETLYEAWAAVVKVPELPAFEAVDQP